jgi:hypothetical protein
MKLAVAECMFPELKGGQIYKIGHGQASTSKAAISRAFADVLKQVSKKRIHQIKANITIVEKATA